MIVSEIKRAPSTLIRNDDGSFRTDANCRLSVEPNRRRHPYYQFLSRNKFPRPITLCRLDQDATSGSPPNITRGVRCLAEPDKLVVPQVLISLRLTSDSFEDVDVDSWARLLASFGRHVTHASFSAEEIHIEGLYKSCSSLLLLRVPLRIWTLLPGEEGMSFIGYVFGGNQAEVLRIKIRAKYSQIQAKGLSPVGKKLHTPSSTSAVADVHIVRADGSVESTSTEKLFFHVRDDPDKYGLVDSRYHQYESPGAQYKGTESSAIR